jgi:predicted acyl esterase
MKSFHLVLKCLAVFLLFSLSGNAQLLTPVVSPIPMRDNQELAANFYFNDSSVARPVVLIQTPYNKNLFNFGLPLGIAQNLETSPYHFVVVDWRGFYGSASAATANPNRGEDGYDCVEWIASQNWCDGQVATWGPSALALIQYQTARENPPSLVCAVPLVGIPNNTSYEAYYTGGVYKTEFVTQLDALGFGVSGLVLANPYYNFLWQAIESNNWYPEEIEVPMLMIGGWYDHNAHEMLNFFQALQNTSGQVAGEHKLLIGPWTHGGSGVSSPGSSQQGELSYPNAANWHNIFANEFLAYYLLNESNNWEQRAPFTYYQMGTNEWMESEGWTPSSSIQTWFCAPEAWLSVDVPAEGQQAINFDARDPSPTVGGTTLSNELEQGPYDQSETVESRADAAVFSTPELTEALEIYGSVRVEAYVSCNRTDTDLAVRLTDVYPDGRSMLLTDGIRRLRMRNGYTLAESELMTPGEIYQLEIDLPELAHTFLPGHQLRLVITGSNYPKYHANLNNGGEMYVPGDTLEATINIHLGGVNATRVHLPLANPVGLSDVETEISPAVFPVPARDFIQVSQPVSNPLILSADGRVVKKLSGQHAAFSVASLSPGVYLLLADELLKPVRFVKE